jgi:hypothetical protein
VLSAVGSVAGSLMCMVAVRQLMAEMAAVDLWDGAAAATWRRLRRRAAADRAAAGTAMVIGSAGTAASAPGSMAGSVLAL